MLGPSETHRHLLSPACLEGGSHPKGLGCGGLKKLQGVGPEDIGIKGLRV